MICDKTLHLQNTSMKLFCGKLVSISGFQTVCRFIFSSLSHNDSLHSNVNIIVQMHTIKN